MMTSPISKQELNTMKSSLAGRVANTVLHENDALLPLFEAVVNSIQAIAESDNRGNGQIDVVINRVQQLTIDGKIDPNAPIEGFSVTDNGVGFTDDNVESFSTLDTTKKKSLGCKGMGRITWLKAFEKVQITSVFKVSNGDFHKRTIGFDTKNEVIIGPEEHVADALQESTTVRLIGFKDPYRSKAPSRIQTLSDKLLAHCIRYLLSDNEPVEITIHDLEDKSICVNEFLNQLIDRKPEVKTKKIGDHDFTLTCLLLKPIASLENSLIWLANGRAVVSDSKFFQRDAKLNNALYDDDGKKRLICLIESKYLDERVVGERNGFAIKSEEGDFLSDLTLDDISTALKPLIEDYVSDLLKASDNENKRELEQAISEWPEFRPILAIKPDIVLPRKATKKKQRALLRAAKNEIADKIDGVIEEQRQKLDPTAKDYLEKVSEYVKTLMSDEAIAANKSALTEYVVRRRAVIDCFRRATEYRRVQGGESTTRYELESTIHSLIMPMKTDSNHVYFEDANLWLLDDRMAFHNYLSSDLKQSVLPISELKDNNDRVDLLVLKEYPETLIVGDGPKGSLSIVEFKRPGRTDKDCIDQVVKYAQQLKNGDITTYLGRPIKTSNYVHAYIVTDITPDHRKDLVNDDYVEVNDDYLYKYRANLRLMIEFITFDEIVRRAKERNYAFFKTLGIDD